MFRALRPGGPVCKHLKPPDRILWPLTIIKSTCALQRLYHANLSLASAPKVAVTLKECYDLVHQDPLRTLTQLQQVTTVNLPEMPLNNDEKVSLVMQAIIEVAVEKRLYLFAGTIYLKHLSSTTISPLILERLLAGFTEYDPVYTPAYLKVLTELIDTSSTSIYLTGQKKATLIESAIEYSKAHPTHLDIVISAFNCAMLAPGEPIPASALYSVIERGFTLLHNGLLANVWTYFKTHYHDALTSHPVILMRLMAYFGKKKHFHPLALEIISLVEPELDNADPAVQLQVVRTCTAMQNKDLGLKLYKRLDGRKKVLDRPLLGAFLVFFTDQELKQEMHRTLAQMKNNKPLNPKELASLVRVIGNRDIESAEELLRSHPSNQQQKTRAHIQLTNESIHLQDQERFNYYLQLLKKTKDVPCGILLNLQLKWQYYNGTFWQARRIYQNTTVKMHIARSQLIIAVNTLTDFLAKQEEPQESLEWLLAECKIKGIPQKHVLTRFNARRNRRDKINEMDNE